MEELAIHLLLSHKSIHPLRLLDFYFSIILNSFRLQNLVVGKSCNRTGPGRSSGNYRSSPTDNYGQLRIPIGFKNLVAVKAVTEPDRTEAPEITEVRRRKITDSYEFRYRNLVPIPVRTK